MTSHRYNKPDEGTTDWHIPLNENFERLDHDVEVRDVESNKGNYEPASGTKFLATDSGAVYTGDGSSWNIIGYVSRFGGGDVGHYVNYPDGLSDEGINKFPLNTGESLEVVRISAPMKGVADGTVNSDVKLRVFDGGIGGTKLVEVDGNGTRTAATDSSAPWVGETSPVTVTISNSTGESVDVAPKLWTNLRL